MNSLGGADFEIIPTNNICLLSASEQAHFVFPHVLAAPSAAGQHDRQYWKQSGQSSGLPRREVGRAGVYWLALGPSARTSGGRLGTATLQPPPASPHTHFSAIFENSSVPHTKIFVSVWYPTHSLSVWETQRAGQ